MLTLFPLLIQIIAIELCSVYIYLFLSLFFLLNLMRQHPGIKAALLYKTD